MKILITGSNGFVGKNLVEYLKTKVIAGENPTVTAYAVPPPFRAREA